MKQRKGKLTREQKNNKSNIGRNGEINTEKYETIIKQRQK